MGIGESHFFLPCLLKSKKVWNNDFPHQNPPQWQNTLLPQGGQQAPVHRTLSLLCLSLLGRGGGKGGRRGYQVFIVHITFSLIASMSHWEIFCLFIYLAALSFLKPRLMHVLNRSSGCSAGGCPCIPAELCFQKYFLTHLFSTFYWCHRAG